MAWESRQVLDLLAELSPVVQALPPSAALVELKGALRYHRADARRLGEIVRLRSVALLGVDVRVGIGPTITVAATASHQISGILAVDPGQVTDWLEPLPVDALHGIGPRQAALLRGYGVDRVGLLAALSPATVQRILGGRAGRLAADRARGIDPRPVAPRTLPTSTSAAVRRMSAESTPGVRVSKATTSTNDQRAVVMTDAVAAQSNHRLGRVRGGACHGSRPCAEPSRVGCPPR
ncbi:hypothetical protein AB0945_34765 [Streptomyces sp. NPDC005474]|uniref:hypothetical protein n=1 Tax=Streptomyces sp. NPDC005474 TaxID=3154878 RepID=UPI0034528CE6